MKKRQNVPSARIEGTYSDLKMMMLLLFHADAEISENLID